ncbi:MAG TPA: rhodanese-like domain-containing protein [Mucilaginibacter sp.]|jgi:rhodanese-related sulfurtransferase
MDRISELLPLPGTVIVDVRTPQEFETGHVANSINIPLRELNSRLEEFKQMQNIIICCASGSRSQKASQFLKQNNVECCDGGSWLNINIYSNNY